MPQTSSAKVFLVRHGATEWTVSGRHTGLTDLPLTEDGRREAVRIGRALADQPIERVFSSPLQRARSTCELAGFGDRMELEPDLVEWNYGAYEGLTSAQIHAQVPDWTVFTHGAPDGESPAQVAARVDRVIARVCALGVHVALFAHGHVLRVLAARWIGLAPAHGAHFLLDTATLSILGHHRGVRALERWNAPEKETQP